MNEHEAFAALVKREPGWLDQPIEDLVKLRAVGDVYLAAHKRMMREIKAGKLNLAEEDLKTRQAEADIVGSAVLDSKVKIGEMSKAEPQARKAAYDERGHFRGSAPTGVASKHERLGLGEKEMERYQVLARNPKAIEEVKAEAREFGDPPTETAVLNKIKYDREKAVREKYEREVTAKKEENIAATRGEALKYLSKLREVVLILPAEVPKEGWSEGSFAEAQTMVTLIRKRLEAWK